MVACKNTALCEEITRYCEEENPTGALFSEGEWGCGKTFFINHTLSNALKDSHIFVRVSLFGIANVDELQNAVKKKWIEAVAEYITQDKVDTGVVSKIFKTFKPVAKACVDTIIDSTVSESKQGIAKSVLSISADQLISISNTFNDKTIVLVFDDLERTDVPMKNVLGCINDYVENQHFNTIIVANEKTIREQEDEKSPENDKKISYAEIKEKVVERQLAFQNAPSEIVAAIIEDESKNTGYHSFLIPLRSTLVELFGSGEKKDEKPHNIRSLKAAIRSFKRVYDKLIEFGIDPRTEPQWLYSYVTYTMVYKKGGLEQKENLLDSERVKALYPGFYSSAFYTSKYKRMDLHRIMERRKYKSRLSSISRKTQS